MLLRLRQPEYLFLLFGLIAGVVYGLLLPPLGGSDEYFHYQRIATIAYGQIFNAAVEVPEGIAQFLKVTTDFLQQETYLPYSQEHFQQVANIPLGDTMATLQPNYMTIHSPANYVPQAIMFRLGAMLGLSPMDLLYLTRMTALLVSLAFTFYAIRIMPVYRYGMAALALLPPLAFYRICLSADPMTTSVGFLFLACMMRELVEQGEAPRGRFLLLVVLGAWLGACKMPYAAATLLWIAIDKQRFSSTPQRIMWILLGIVPAWLAGLWWMDVSRHGVFMGLQYETWGGKAYPDGQMAWIKAHPIDFLAVISTTLTMPSFWLQQGQEILGHIGTAVQSDQIYYIVMSLLLFTTFIGVEDEQLSFSAQAKVALAPVYIFFLYLTLTALYVHWNGVGADKVLGFQGRYFYPLLPALFILLPRRGWGKEGIVAIMFVVFAAAGIALTTPMLLSHWK